VTNSIHSSTILMTPSQFWDTLRDRLENASTKLGITEVLWKLTASCPWQDETVTDYFTKRIAFRKKLIGTTKMNPDDSMKTHICTTQSNSYEMTMHLLQQGILAPTAQQCMDAIRKYAKRTTLIKEIGDPSTRAAQSSRRRKCCCDNCG